MTTRARGRLAYIDVLKILACLAIILLHLSALYVTQPAVTSRAALLANSLTRPAVFLFVMISGALLLREDYTFPFKRKFLFILKTYALWSALFVAAKALARLATGGVPLSWQEIVSGWIQGPYHFWYLQMLLGIYLLMPLLEKLKGLRVLNYATLLMGLAIYIYQPLAPHLPTAVQNVMGQLIVQGPSGILFYFFLGACLHRLPRSRKVAALAGALFLFGNALSLLVLAGMLPSSAALTSDCQLFVTTGIFYLVRYLADARTSAPRLAHLSNCTLRIYIASALFIEAYGVLVQPLWDRLVPTVGLSLLFWSLVVFALSALWAHLLAKKDAALAQRRARHH